MTIKEAAEIYAKEVRDALSFHASEPHEVSREVEYAFIAGAEKMKEYIFQIYDNDGDMDFVKWKLNQEEL